MIGIHPCCKSISLFEVCKKQKGEPKSAFSDIMID